MSSHNKQTTDPQIIRKWAEARGGQPARVKSTGSDNPKKAGLLRIDFPGGAGEESLEPIDWDTFSETFEAQKLAFVYEEKSASGDISRFGKFVSRENT